MLRLYPLVRPRKRDASDLFATARDTLATAEVAPIDQSYAPDCPDSRSYSREWPPELGPASDRSGERLFVIKESTDMDLRRECGDAECIREVVGELGAWLDVSAVMNVSCDANDELVIIDSVTGCLGIANGGEETVSGTIVGPAERDTGIEPAVVPVIVWSSFSRSSNLLLSGCFSLQLTRVLSELTRVRDLADPHPRLCLSSPSLTAYLVSPQSEHGCSHFCSHVCSPPVASPW